MIRTGFYGGSFNPIHNGHIALARRFLEDMKLDEVWFVVSPQNPFKRESNDLLDNQQRLQIVQTAIAHEPRFHATDYEFRLPTPSYTWRTLQHLAQDEPEREFTLLIGADNWASFNRWTKTSSPITASPSTPDATSPSLRQHSLPTSHCSAHRSTTSVAQTSATAFVKECRWRMSCRKIFWKWP